jgi:hypothetical protein
VISAFSQEKKNSQQHFNPTPDNLNLIVLALQIHLETMRRPVVFLLLLPLIALSTSTDTPSSSSPPLPPCGTPPNPSNPLWKLTNWSTDFTVPNEQRVLFHLANTLTGYKAECLREGPFPNGVCVGIPAEGSEGSEDDTGSIFSYNEQVGVLEVYQEWSCLGEGRWVWLVSVVWVLWVKLTGGSSVTKRMQAGGKVSVLDGCTGGEAVKKGEMCGAQGEIYAERIEVVDQ